MPPGAVHTNSNARSELRIIVACQWCTFFERGKFGLKAELMGRMGNFETRFEQRLDDLERKP